MILEPFELRGKTIEDAWESKSDLVDTGGRMIDLHIRFTDGTEVVIGSCVGEFDMGDGADEIYREVSDGHTQIFKQ